jgi:hypothetical protein|tara:strand:- start:792 stop:1025 length:234 start_codon:yes stop_codon:yes gene_type:complete
MEPKNLNIKGRKIPVEEMANLRQYFNGMDYLVETMSIVDANIVNAKNEEAAHTWVQWLINVALQSFDSNIASILTEE